MKQHYIFIFVLIISVLSCKMQDTKQSAIKGSSLNTEKLSNTKGYEMQIKGIDFSAGGIDSDWSLEIDFDQKVKFTSAELSKDIVISVNTSINQIDGEGTYCEFTKGGKVIRVRITKNENPFLSSEDRKPYAVNVEVKAASDSEFVSYTGQGEYYGSLVLHDIWGLDSINDKSVSAYQCEKRPYVEIHLDNNRINGFLGCNTFGSKVYFGLNTISIHHLMSTKMACLNSNIEDDFAGALSNHTYKYKVENGVLTLWNDSEKLIFKKMD
ncbi:META domain-containing protein [Plebeiibacterium sediminum]|uniref:META domain-containing protein n=1 Tax=Plebeiibacterium sediminum TaxID=2992112 RepID=A0AAE3SDV7_9BACT|nr:META domain-containing protein [Plebeiobacterium sediminum]MCW3785476.1 META domain-containing protein [Plebeiobacterium sediminum]